MGTSQRIDGLANQMADKAGRGVAEVIGAAPLQAGGLAQGAEGRSPQALADAKPGPEAKVLAPGAHSTTAQPD